MGNLWGFFENINEIVYVADIETLWRRPKGSLATGFCAMAPSPARSAAAARPIRAIMNSSTTISI